MRALNAIALLLVVVGALNWGLVGLFELDLVAELVGEEFGATNALSRIVYVLVGAAGLYLAVAVLPALIRDATERTSREHTVRA